MNPDLCSSPAPSGPSCRSPCNIDRILVSTLTAVCSPVRGMLPASRGLDTPVGIEVAPHLVSAPLQRTPGPASIGAALGSRSLVLSRISCYKMKETLLYSISLLVHVKSNSNYVHLAPI